MESNNNNNQELRRLEKKAKTGWAAFYRSQRDLHDVIDSYIVDVRNLEQQIANHEGMPQHIMNELKELYEKMKKQVSCPICWTELKVDEINFSSCGHKYCKNCLIQIKSQPSPKCAICRRKLF